MQAQFNVKERLAMLSEGEQRIFLRPFLFVVALQSPLIIIVGPEMLDYCISKMNI